MTINVVVLVSDARGLATVESLRTDPGDHENVALPSTVRAATCPLQIVMSGPAEIAGRAPIFTVASRSIVLPDAERKVALMMYVPGVRYTCDVGFCRERFAEPDEGSPKSHCTDVAESFGDTTIASVSPTHPSATTMSYTVSLEKTAGNMFGNPSRLMRPPRSTTRSRY